MAINICNIPASIYQKELVPHGNPAFPAACYAYNMEFVSVSFHWHDEFEFIMADAGMLRLHIGTEQLILPAKAAVFINSGCLHSVEKNENGPGMLKSLVIHPKLIAGSKDSCFWQTLITPFSENTSLQYMILDGSQSWHQTAVDLMMAAWNAITSRSYDFENESRYLISRAFRLMSDHGMSASQATLQDSNTIVRMKKLLRYIDEHYAEDITNQTLMDLIPCSESVLLRSFKLTVGVSPMRYVKDFRLEKAALLLLSTTKKSCDIAMECGFSDFSYFTKAFRQKMGRTPVAYRKENTV